MSVGGSLPYQLRPNKAVERLLFAELLRRLDPIINIEDRFDYIGFGGPQMEDFRLLHECFPQLPMISIEENKQVLKRQKFNTPHTAIKYCHQTSTEYIDGFRPTRPSVMWLDFTKPQQRQGQIEEFQSVLRKLKEYSIVKITLNASASSLGGVPGRTLQQDRLNTFLSQFGRFPLTLTEDDMTTNRFPAALLQVVECAAIDCLRNRAEWRFQPLTHAVYADGQTMLTVTGILLRRSSIPSITQNPKISTWFFRRMDWTNSLEIDVPELTLKERIYINQLLPKNCEDMIAIQRKLGFLVDEDETSSLNRIKSYIDFYRHYPHFGKVAI